MVFIQLFCDWGRQIKPIFLFAAIHAGNIFIFNFKGIMSLKKFCQIID
jgi:hypothetical protein